MRRQVIVLADRQYTTRGLDASLVNDRSTIMQRAILAEDRQQQPLVDLCVDGISGFDVEFKFSVAREHYQRTGMCRLQVLDGLHHLVYIEVVMVIVTP